MVYAVLAFSVMLNALLIWFGYKLIRKSLSYSENIYFLMDDMDSFVAHLEAIYELTTFYGDETLQSLILHSKRLREGIEEFRQNSALEIGDGEEEMTDEEKEEEERS